MEVKDRMGNTLPQRYWWCPVCGFSTSYSNIREQNLHWHQGEGWAVMELRPEDYYKAMEGVMKCESCGQEKPEPKLKIGDKVEITAAENSVWAGIGVVDWVWDNGSVNVTMITGHFSGHKGTFYRARIVHGYIHINRDSMDYTRHAV